MEADSPGGPAADADHDAEADADDTDPDPGPEPDAEDEVEAEAEDPDPDPEPDADADHDADGPDPESAPEPGPEPEADPEPAAESDPASSDDAAAGEGRVGRSGIGRRGGLRLSAGLLTVMGGDQRPADLAGWGPVHAELAADLALRLGSWWCVLVGRRRHPTDDRGDPPPPHHPTGPDRRLVGEVWLHTDEATLRLAQGLARTGLIDPGWVDVLAEITRKLDTTPAGPPNGDPTARLPGAALRRWIHLRDTRCTFPGCRAPAHRTDTDHTLERAKGGATVDSGLAAACRHDHRLRHQGGWHVEHDQPGQITWTSRTGPHLPAPPPARPARPAPTTTRRHRRARPRTTTVRPTPMGRPRHLPRTRNPNHHRHPSSPPHPTAPTTTRPRRSSDLRTGTTGERASERPLTAQVHQQEPELQRGGRQDVQALKGLPRPDAGEEQEDHGQVEDVAGHA